MEASTGATWGEYERWNAALATVSEQRGAGGQPLYLELDDEAVQLAGKLTGLQPENPKQRLISVVSDTLDIGPASPPLATHARHLQAWKPGHGDVPPCLAFLYVCSAAAADMRASDGLSSANYYGRLGRLLALDVDGQHELERGYRKHAEAMWAALNSWLEHHEGEKGLPTAFALRHRYAGLPMSQALVRRGDRSRLHRFFAIYGLPPRGDISGPDLLPMLDDWITTYPPPVSAFLRELWEQGEARERIAAVVSLELSEWDGTTDLPPSEVAETGSVRVVGRLQRFPTRRLVLDLSLRLGGAPDEAVVDVVGEDGNPALSIPFRRAGDGSLTIDGNFPLDPTTLVSGFVRLSAGGATVERKPRLLVPMRFEDLLQAFVETERLQLGESSMVLAPAARRSEVEAALQACAAPGWQVAPDIPGLPEEWVLFTSVEVYSSLNRDDHRWAELDALVPHGATQLSLAGGLRLPTKLRKWSTLRPPEVRAVVPNGQPAELVVAPASGGGQEHRWSSDSGVLAVPLAEAELPDGDYIARLRVAGKRDALAESTIRLRSADTPNRIAPRPDLGYGHGPRGAFSASEGGPVRGVAGAGAAAQLDTPRRLPPAHLETLAVRRVHRKVTVPERPLVLGVIPEDSCILTGAHRIHLPPALGPARRGWVIGTCNTCGLKRRFPATARQARKKTAPASNRLRRPIRLTHLRPASFAEGVDWQLGFDALCHLGRGTSAALERVAMQVEPSRLFVDAFTRTLEVLGYIDVARNAQTWRPEAWQVPPPALVSLGGDRWFLTGWRSAQLISALSETASRHGASLEVEPQPDAPAGIFLRGADPDLAQQICQEAEMALPAQRIFVAPEAPLQLAAATPAVASLVADLLRTTLGDVRKVACWDPETARWEDVATPGSGFLRVEGAVSTYCIRTSDDVRDGVIRPLPVHLLKHVAGALHRRPLVAWEAESMSLSVPKGCDLPGLLGRAAALSSGRPPQVAGDVLVYRDVPAEVAGEIFRSLGG